MTATVNSLPKTESPTRVEVKERAAELGGQLTEKAHVLGEQVSQRAEEVANKLPELNRPEAWALNVGPPERMLSVVGGLALVGFGIVRRTPASAAFGLVGGYLLVRGLAGHCVVYQGLGIDRVNGSNLLAG